MDIIATPKRKRKRRKLFREPAKQDGVIDGSGHDRAKVQMAMTPTSTGEEEVLDLDGDQQVRGHLCCRPDILPSDPNDWLFEGSEPDELMLGEEVEWHQAVLELPTIDPSSHTQQFPSCKRSSSTAEALVLNEEKPGLEQIMRLIDAAVRMSITDSPRRIDKAVKVSRQESFVRFVDIAPSLWSPGYSPAVASRAVFLPTISHALASVGARRCQNASLASKIAELGRQSRVSDSDRQCTKGLEQSLSTAWWRLLQRGCYNPDAAAYLKPLCGKGVPEFGGDEHEPLLDANQDRVFHDRFDHFDHDEGDLYDSGSESDEDLFDSWFRQGVLLPNYSSITNANISNDNSPDAMHFECGTDDLCQNEEMVLPRRQGC